MKVLVIYYAIICALCILARKRIISLMNVILYSIAISILYTSGFQAINKYIILGGMTDPFIIIAVAVQLASSLVLCLTLLMIFFLINRGAKTKSGRNEGDVGTKGPSINK